MNRQQKGTLSEKFSKIAAKNIAVTSRQTRKIVVVRGQANKRTTQVNAKRGITFPNQQAANGAPKRPLVKNQPKGGRGNTRGRGGRGRGGRGNNDRRNNKDSSKSQTDLDLEMDSYWFAAGKGPNPVVAALDKDMDNYFKGRVDKEETPPEANNV